MIRIRHRQRNDSLTKQVSHYLAAVHRSVYIDTPLSHLASHTPLSGNALLLRLSEIRALQAIGIFEETDRRIISRR
jgi:hypothetical protein